MEDDEETARAIADLTADLRRTLRRHVAARPADDPEISHILAASLIRVVREIAARADPMLPAVIAAAFGISG